MRNGLQTGITTADLVMRGGRVHTMDGARTVAQALAVSGGTILRTGTDAEVAPLVGPGTRVVELRGRSLIPGINDSHLHGAWLGTMWPDTLMAQLAAAAPTGGGPDHPGGGHRHDAHGHDGHGHDGHGHDHAGEGPALAALTTPAERRRAILRTGDLLASLGVTSYTEPGLGPGEDAGPTGCFSSAVLHEYAALAAEGLLRARVTALLLFGLLDGASSATDLLRGLAGFRAPAEVPGWFRVAGVKIFADGIPPMGSAWSEEPYADGGHGALLVDGADAGEREVNLRSMIRAAHAAGHQIGVHATGSRTTRVVTGAFAEARATDGRDGRHYLIHGDVVHPATLAAMAAAGVGLNTQPGIAAATAPMLAGALGPDALAHAWPVRDALTAGVPLCLSSDAPVLAPDWRAGVAAAATRAGADGTAGGRGQRLALDEALYAYTVAPARQDGAERWKGTLEAGKVADLCLLGADLRDVDPGALPEVPVAMTVVDGRVVHEV
ncbi:amidohydrolase family protein [Streptomyces sp. BE20]|uniref:amidohydrolase n=1 Tax=Streptomyces sp. BE20 TaxID=3002525 RepID=UPI002E7AAAC4|nr:amidohydrolase family protein [Streptomyces sp. BE20]MEE1824039.1 amidohydrolase family protein [Streptomyces sp. BE20]